MKIDSRVILFAGHYGSGKTNLALSFARHLKNSGERVAIADLDIVNPYFRTKDSAAQLASEGIELVVSDYANSNVDFPAMPREIYALVAERDRRVVMDIGGDDRGALALGRYVPDLRAENDYAMLAVVNAARPLTRTPADALGVLAEIEAACGLPFTGIVNNTNLGQKTTAADVLGSLDYANEISRLSKLPLVMTSVAAPIAKELEGKVPNLFPVEIQKLYYQLEV